MIIDGIYSIREHLWDLPVKAESLYSRSKPLSSIVLFSFIAIYLFTLFASPTLYGKSSQYEGEEKYTEGIVGDISTLNPMFITGSDIDRSVQSLLFQKLINIEDGNPIPAFAEEWQVLPGGKSIKFILRDDLYWHDGEKMTPDDVVYTVVRSQEMAESGYDTYGGALAGVEIVADSDNSVTFTFDEVVGSVFEALSIYIMPEHIIKDIDNPSLYNYGRILLPIGSGPYQAVRVEDGDILLKAVEDYPEDVSIPFIEFLFFDDVNSLEVAFRNNLLDGLGNIDPYNFKILNEYPAFKAYTMKIPQRKKVLFLNMRDDTMKNSPLRYAIANIIDKEALVEELSTAFQTTNTPIPSNSWAYRDDVVYYKYDLEEAKAALKSAGYTIDKDSGKVLNGDGEQLVIDFVYLDSSDNEELADSIEKMFNEVGIELSRRDVSYDSLINEVLATRNFEMVLSELEVTNDPDQYDLWHSTKVNFPDLNISGYEYDRMDLGLEDARVETNKKVREDEYYEIQRYLALDVPVVTLYEPSYSYILKEKYKNLLLENASFPFERFWNVTNWEIEE